MRGEVSREARAGLLLHAEMGVTAPPSPEFRSGASQTTYAGPAGADRPAPPDQTESRAGATTEAAASMTGSPPIVEREGRARVAVKAYIRLTVPPALIDEIRLHYRLAKSAEAARIAIDQKLASFVRVYLTAWTPDGEELTREKASKQALRVVETVRKGAEPAPEDEALCIAVSGMVLAMEPTRAAFDDTRKRHRKEVETRVKTLLAWEVMGHVKGFSLWGLGALVGEVGNIGDYPGCRHVFKRLGLAPNECYPKGEKSTGRMIPRMARGRIMGVIADPLLRAQWRGEKDDVPAHPIGPFGKVYGETKARHLEAGKTKGHADKTARRAMVKALIHDVHHAWHGVPLDYV